MKLSYLLAGSLLLLSACSTTQTASTAPAAAAATDATDATSAATVAIAAAKQANKDANKLGFEWRDSDKFLKEAEEALAAGDLKKATKLAKKAELFGKAAQEQAIAEKNAAPRF